MMGLWCQEWGRVSGIRAILDTHFYRLFSSEVSLRWEAWLFSRSLLSGIVGHQVANQKWREDQNVQIGSTKWR